MDSVNVTLDVNLFVMVAVIIVYLGAVAFLSWLGRVKSRGDDFASGGRNIPSAVMALSYGAAFISTSAIVGFGGMAAEIGMSLMPTSFSAFFWRLPSSERGPVRSV